jgi:hypothetical protein
MKIPWSWVLLFFTITAVACLVMGAAHLAANAVAIGVHAIPQIQ